MGSALHLGRPVGELRRANGGWLLRAAGGDPVQADAVVLAAPVHAVSELLKPLSAAASEALGGIHSAPVAVIGLGYREDQLQEYWERTPFLQQSFSPF